MILVARDLWGTVEYERMASVCILISLGSRPCAGEEEIERVGKAWNRGIEPEHRVSAAMYITCV